MSDENKKKDGRDLIWNKVNTTDLSKTTTNKLEGRDVTTINTNHFLEKATEIFGPIGIGWGYNIEKSFLEKSRSVECGDEVVHTILICFWYELDGKRGTFQSYGHTYFSQIVSQGKRIKTNEDYAKKSLSDAIKKALSMLGFCDDIYSGSLSDENIRNNETYMQYSEKISNARKELDDYIATIPEKASSLSSRKSIEHLFRTVNIKLQRMFRDANTPQDEQKLYYDRLMSYQAKVTEELKAKKT